MNNKQLLGSEEYLKVLIEELEVDILFECFAGLTARTKEIDANNFHVIPKENDQRNYKNDIVPATLASDFEPQNFFDENPLDVLTMYTSRSAILDYLPEDFYAKPDNTDEFYKENGLKRTTEELEKYRAKAKAEIKSAVRFFSPIEIEYNKIRIKRELEELAIVENLDLSLNSFWKEFPMVDEKWNRFIRTLHLTSSIIGDKEKTIALIEYVLGTSVSLSFDVEEYVVVSAEELKTLTGNTSILGFNVNVGNIIYDYLEIVTLRVKDLSREAFSTYFDKTSDDRKLLEEIINYYFPLNVEVKLDFSIKSTPASQDEKTELGVLGYSSKL